MSTKPGCETGCFRDGPTGKAPAEFDNIWSWLRVQVLNFKTCILGFCLDENPSLEGFFSFGKFLVEMTSSVLI